MIVHKLNFRRALTGPAKAKSVLVIDPNAELPFALTFQCFEPVAWRERKNSRVCAASSCANFRVVTFAIVENLLHLPVSNRAFVSLQRNPLIMGHDITLNVKRQEM